MWRHLVDRLSPEQIGVLGDIAETVVSHLRDVHGRRPPADPGEEPAG